jgi:hypothetical protein
MDAVSRTQHHRQNCAQDRHQADRNVIEGAKGAAHGEEEDEEYDADQAHDPTGGGYLSNRVPAALT